MSSLNRYHDLVRTFSKRQIVMLGGLVAANLTLLLILGVQKIERAGTETIDLRTLPAIEIRDDAGNKILLNTLTGKPRVVQFVNPQVATQVDAVTKLVGSFDKSELEFVLITAQSIELRRAIPTLGENVFVVQHDYAELKRKFKVPECCEQRFVFDETGNLRFRDYYYEADLTPRISMLVKKDLESPSSAIYQIANSQQRGAFASLKERTRQSPSAKAVVILLTSVSSTCPSGNLVRALSRYSDRRDVQFEILLPEDYSALEVQNFQRNFRVNVEIQQFDPELSQQWAALISLYGDSRINPSAVFFNGGELTVAVGDSEIQQQFSRL